MDPRAWVGVNLGRSPNTPGAYQIWVPSEGRVVLTSDAYFMESSFPRRGVHTAPADGDVPPIIPFFEHNPIDQPAGVPSSIAACRSDFASEVGGCTRQQRKYKQ